MSIVVTIAVLLMTIVAMAARRVLSPPKLQPAPEASVWEVVDRYVEQDKVYYVFQDQHGMRRTLWSKTKVCWYDLYTGKMDLHESEMLETKEQGQ